MLPPVSVPTSKGDPPALTIAAAPPLLPPGVLEVSNGLFVFPNIRLSVLKERVNSGVLVLPINIAPSLRRRSTQVASLPGRNSRRPAVPHVVIMSKVSRESLIVMGTPKSFPGVSPACRAMSARSACCIASSGSNRITALSSGLTASIRSRNSFVRCLLVVCLLRIALASSRTDSLNRSSIGLQDQLL